MYFGYYAGSLDPYNHGVTLRQQYSRVGAVKVVTEEGDNLLSRKEVTIATKPQPISRHLLI